MILLPQKWKRQPTVPMVVDWNHPLAQGLIEFGYALPGLVPYSAVAAGSQQPFVTGAGTQDATTNGHAITVNGTGNYINLGRNISAPTQVASGFVRSTYHGVGTNYLAAAESGSVWVGHRLRAGASGAVEARWGDGGGTTDPNNYRRGLTPSAILTSGAAPFSLAFVCRAATDWSIYKDGANQGALTYGGTASTYSAGTLNGRINFNAGGEYGQQSTSTWGYWGRALNDGEMQALHEAPFQLLVKRQRRIWVAVGGGGNITLAADTGTFALSGQAASPLVARNVSADTGAFALAGQAASPLVSRVVAADTGAFAMSGQQAGMVAARTVAADTGAFALAGIDAGVIAGRRMAADPGAFAVGGQAADLLASRSIGADTGAFALDGTPAGLFAARIITADFGAFVVTGYPADLGGAAGITLTAEAGAFGLSGQAADLLVARRVTADAGAFVVAGSDAALIASRNITADAGAFGVAGIDAELAIARRMLADTGIYALDGSDASLIAALRLAAETGAYLITGNSAQLGGVAAALEIACIFRVPAQTRTFRAPAEARTIKAPAVQRTIRIPKCTT